MFTIEKRPNVLFLYKKRESGDKFAGVRIGVPVMTKDERGFRKAIEIVNKLCRAARKGN